MSTKKEIEEERAKLITDRNSLEFRISELDNELTIIENEEKKVIKDKYRTRVVRNIFNHVSVYSEDKSGFKRKREEEVIGETQKHQHLTNDLLVVILSNSDSIWDVIAFLSTDKRYHRFIKRSQFKEVVKALFAYESGKFRTQTTVKGKLVDIYQGEPTVLKVMYLEVINAIEHKKDYFPVRYDQLGEDSYYRPLEFKSYKRLSLLDNAYVFYFDNTKRVVKVLDYIKEKKHGTDFHIASTANVFYIFDWCSPPQMEKIPTSVMRNVEFTPYSPNTAFHASYVVDKIDVMHVHHFVNDSIATLSYTIMFITMNNNYKPSYASLKQIRFNTPINNFLSLTRGLSSSGITDFENKIHSQYVKEKLKLEKIKTTCSTTTLERANALWSEAVTHYMQSFNKC